MVTNLVQNCGKITYPPALIALSFWNKMGYDKRNVCINSVNDASILCENFMKFGPVTPELTLLIVNVRYDTAKKSGAF